MDRQSSILSIILFVTACWGATALGAEVVWTRLLALLLGPTGIKVFVDQQAEVAQLH